MTRWPVWAQGLALLRTEEDRGVGDTVHRVIGKRWSAAYVRWYERTFGEPCGCCGRREEWNRTYQYAAKTAPKPHLGAENPV